MWLDQTWFAAMRFKGLTWECGCLLLPWQAARWGLCWHSRGVQILVCFAGLMTRSVGTFPQFVCAWPSSICCFHPSSASSYQFTSLSLLKPSAFGRGRRLLSWDFWFPTPTLSAVILVTKICARLRLLSASVMYQWVLAYSLTLASVRFH